MYLRKASLLIYLTNKCHFLFSLDEHSIMTQHNNKETICNIKMWGGEYIYGGVQKIFQQLVY